MRKKIVLLSLFIQGMTFFTIGQYIARIPNYCRDFDSGAVAATYRSREQIAAPRLKESQITMRYRRQLRGGYFARSAARAAGIRKGCQNPIPTAFTFSRSRSS